MSRPQRILHVIAELDGYGLTRQLELLVQGQLAAGHEVCVLALATNRRVVEGFRRLGVECRTLERRWRRDPFVAMRLARELSGRTVDVLHVWDEASQNYLAAVRRLPILRTRLLEAAVVSQRVPPGVIMLDPQGLTREQFLAEQVLEDDVLLIAVGGPLTRAQQIDEAIWYFELVRTLDQRVRLLIFGDGPERHRLERFARLTSEPEAIRWLGYRADFRELLPCVDMFWHTYAVAEEPQGTLPITVLEAMAARLPIVGHESSGCRQLITHEESGLLLADKDRAGFARETLRLIEDLSLSARLSERARADANTHFSAERMLQSYAEIYEAA